MNYKIKDFLPLIIIFSIIILATFIRVYLAGNWEIHLILNSFMAFFFLIFSCFKIINLKNFAQAYSEYDLIAKQSKLYAFIYPFIEFTLGILYLFNFYPFYTNVITLIIMSISALGVAKELSKGKQIVCACLGAVFKIPMTYVTLAEDLLMALMALVMLIM